MNRSRPLASLAGVANAPLIELPDEALLAGFGSGDQELAVAFVRRFQAKVYGVALAVLGTRGAAEDIAQQTFERAWRHARTYDSRRSSVAVWLSEIARDLAIDTIRVRPSVPVDASELVERLVDPSGGGTSPEHAPLAAEQTDELRRVFRGLPPEQARAVVLAGIGGLSASQVAASEHIPLGTAKARICAAMRRLGEARIDCARGDVRAGDGVERRDRTRHCHAENRALVRSVTNS